MFEFFPDYIKDMVKKGYTNKQIFLNLNQFDSTDDSKYTL